MRGSGAPLEESLTAELLSQLKLVDWSNNTRPGVEASGYVTLKKVAHTLPVILSDQLPMPPEHTHTQTQLLPKLL